jgi:diguanylate cyclase (GGDEF)-like protein
MVMNTAAATRPSAINARDRAARDVYELEAQFVCGVGADLGEVETMLERVRGLSDPALLGRALCLYSRALILYGRHEAGLRAADEGARVFARLAAAAAQPLAGVHAETFRAAGTALFKLGRIAEALPQLEEGVRLATAAIDAGEATTTTAVTVISPGCAQIRSLIMLGVALFAIRDIDAAIEVYECAIAAADADPPTSDTFLDEVQLARWNLTDALHERAARHRAAGRTARADRDILAARRLLEAEAWRVTTPAPGAVRYPGGPSTGTLSPFGRASYYAALGRHFLICGEPAQARAAFEDEFVEIYRQPYVDECSVADVQTGLAQCALALDAPLDALVHGEQALCALDRHDESELRATVLLACAQAHQALGEHAAAYDLLQAHHALRAKIEAVAAQQYAGHMTAKLGLERAHADAESHRRIAAMLATLGRIGQEITATLDRNAVFAIYARHAADLLHVTAFGVYLLEPDGTSLQRVFDSEFCRASSAAGLGLEDAASPQARALSTRYEVVDTNAPLPLRTVLYSPLVVADRVLGLVIIGSERAGAYAENEVSIVHAIGAYAAIALDNAAAYTKLEHTVNELQATQRELEHLSMTDMLTRVANRRYLHERARAEIAALRRSGGELAVVIFDIDHFKRVNDTYGHAAGDAVLQRVAQAATDRLRPTDLVARIGGEEFALLLPGAALSEATAVAERIRAKIAETDVVTQDATIHVTSSFGIAMFDAAADTFDRALNRADAALYRAKQAGRDRIHVA